MNGFHFLNCWHNVAHETEKILLHAWFNLIPCFLMGHEVPIQLLFQVWNCFILDLCFYRGDERSKDKSKIWLLITRKYIIVTIYQTFSEIDNKFDLSPNPCSGPQLWCSLQFFSPVVLSIQYLGDQIQQYSGFLLMSNRISYS